MQYQLGSSFKLVIHQVWLQNLIPNFKFCPETIFLFLVMVTLTREDPMQYQRLHIFLLYTKCDYNIFLKYDKQGQQGKAAFNELQLLSGNHFSIF
jgi:hypothetical protein